MMSLGEIDRLSREAAKKARREKKLPLVLGDAADVAHLGQAGYRIPNLGTHRPKGWKLVDSWLCDASGVGAEYEPALTQQQLKARITEKIAEGKDYGYAVIEQGQFQVVLGVFEKVKRGSLPKGRSQV